MENPAIQEKAQPSAANAAADPMVGRGMLWMDNNGIVQWQGHVIAALGGEHYLIQLISMPIGDQISCPMADPTDQIVVHISSFAVASPYSKGKPMFYDGPGGMRDAYNNCFIRRNGAIRRKMEREQEEEAKAEHSRPGGPQGSAGY